VASKKETASAPSAQAGPSLPPSPIDPGPQPTRAGSQAAPLLEDDNEIDTSIDLREVGNTGLKVFSGYINEEFLTQLRGTRGVAIFREMSDNDANIGAFMRAIDLTLRKVTWDAEAANDTAEAKREAEFALSLFGDMSHPFDDLISEALSMMIYGWSYHEIVLKNRVGPHEKDPAKRSKYTDGRVGIRKLPIRSQDSLVSWDMQDDGGINGMRQQPPQGGQRYVPIQRALLFRTVSRKNSPEGVSLLRNAYRSWYFLKRIEEIEVIGIERELAGLPVVTLPADVMNSQDPKDLAIVNAYKQIARDVKFNKQGGLLLPSDPWRDKDGNPTEIKKVDLRLLTSGGTRAIDTDKVATRHQQNMLRSMLADFLMLGSNSVGSFALSADKSGFFMNALEALLDAIANPINMFLLPRIWDYNGLDRDLMPQMKPGRIAPVDLDKLGNYLRNLIVSGVTLPDEGLDEFSRDVAGLPPPLSVGTAGESARRGRGNNVDDPNARPDNSDPGNSEAVPPFQKQRFRKDYNPDQPRDEDGKWADGAGGGAVHPAPEDVHEVADSNFEHSTVQGDKTVPIESLRGGVNLSDPGERARVDRLKARMNGADGYIARLITADNGDVLEGQHRLDALRELGAKQVHVTQIRDNARGANVSEMRSAIRNVGALHSDHVHQIIGQSLEMLQDEGGSADKVLQNYDLSGPYEQHYIAALRAANFKKS